MLDTDPSERGRIHRFRFGEILDRGAVQYLAADHDARAALSCDLVIPHTRSAQASPSESGGP